MGEEEATNVTAGIWGFLTLFLLAMICWLLYRSMSKHLRNVRLKQEAADAAASQGTAAVKPASGDGSEGGPTK